MSLPKNYKKKASSKDTVIATGVQNATADTEVPEVELPSSDPPTKSSKGAGTWEDDPYNKAIIKSYNEELDKEINKGLTQIHERYIRLMSQENPSVDMRPAVDELGHSSDWYKNLFWAIKDGAEPGTKEQIYKKLEAMNFTNMRQLEAIQQQYPSIPK